MDRACSVNGGEEEWIEKFGRKTRMKEISSKN
jgi:hypothetical protein